MGFRKFPNSSSADMIHMSVELFIAMPTKITGLVSFRKEGSLALQEVFMELP
jgi:hypothetical protein